MITIKCNIHEKEDLIRVFDYSDSCLFRNYDEIICKQNEKDCHVCFDENINWIIEENDTENDINDNTENK